MASHRTAAVDTTWITVLVIATAATLALLPSANGEDVACSPDGEVCVSPTTDEILVLGAQFRRVCEYSGPENPGAELEWLRDGQPVESEPQTNSHQLIIDSLDNDDAGTYSCVATLTNGTVIGPVPAGTIRIFDASQITISPDSYILNGTNHSLTCETELESSQIFWKNGSDGTYLSLDSVLTLTSVNVTTEGNYTCEIHNTIVGKIISETVIVHVLVPHLILSTPPTYRLISGNSREVFTVEFQGREEQNTTVTWLKDGVVLSPENSQGRIETTFQSEQLRGTSSLIFDPISRRDMGVYQMILDSNLGSEVFPDAERMAEMSFQVDVVVPPSLPTDLMFTTVNLTTARVTWVLTNHTTEAGADTLTLVVSYSDKIDEYVLPGSETGILIPVVPGTDYEFTLTARNTDGSVTTEPAQFQTSPGAPSISDVFIVRMNETSFNLIMAVEYTGGGDITHFDISYRHDSNLVYDSLGQIPATASPNSMLQWNGIVIIPELQDISGQLQFRVSALNSRGLRSTTEAPENLVHPGAPLQPSLISSTTSSLTISVQLSQEGSAPILKLTALITNSELQFSTTYNASGSYNPGDTISFTVEELSANEPYVIVTYATNSAGNGPRSQEITFITDPLDSVSESIPLPLWAIVVIGGGVVILVIVLITCALICYRYRRRPRKRNYSVNKRPQKPMSPLRADMHHLDSSNPLVSRHDKTLVTLTNGGITVSTFTAPKPQDRKRHTRNTDDLGQRNTSTTSFEDSPPTTKSRLERGSSTILPQRSSRAVSNTTLESSTPASIKRESEVSDNGNENENEDSGVEVERSNPALTQSASSTLPRSTSIPREITPDPAFQRELEHRVQTHSSSALLQETSVQRSASVTIPGANLGSSYKASDHQLKSESSHTLPLTGDFYRTSSASATVTHARNITPSHFNQRFQNEITSTSSCNASASEVTDSSVDLDYPRYMPSLHDYRGESIHSLPTLRSGIAIVHSTQESSVQYPVHTYSSQYVSDV